MGGSFRGACHFWMDITTVLFDYVTFAQLVCKRQDPLQNTIHVANTIDPIKLCHMCNISSVAFPP